MLKKNGTVGDSVLMFLIAVYTVC